MSKFCPICRSQQLQVRAVYRGSHPIFSGLGRVHCNSCGMVFASPMPSETSLIEYNSCYFSSAHGGHQSSRTAAAFFSAIARLRMAHIERYIESLGIHVRNILELGPGTGVFAKNWLEKYPKTTYMACETDISCHTSLQTMGVSLLDSVPEDVDTEVDLIVMSHVLEHVADPIQFLTTATKNLRQGGAIFIEVPCHDYLHKTLDEPHLLFFDKEPMRCLLQQLGFDNIQLSYHGVTLNRLKSVSNLLTKFIAFRSKLITLGITLPFSRIQKGMESLTDPVERATVAPFRAHIESTKPAWWLRVVAKK